MSDYAIPEIKFNFDPESISRFKKNLRRPIISDTENNPFKRMGSLDFTKLEKRMEKIQLALMTSFDMEYMKGVGCGFVGMGKALPIDIAGKSLREHAKSFPIMSPPGTQFFVVDSMSELSKAEKAFIAMSHIGVSARKAGEAMIALTKKLNKLDKEPESDPIYSKSQSQHWANKWNHKRPKNL